MKKKILTQYYSSVLFVEMGNRRYGSGKRKRGTSSVQITSSKSAIISFAKLYSQYDHVSGFDITTQVLIDYLIDFNKLLIFKLKPKYCNANIFIIVLKIPKVT